MLDGGDRHIIANSDGDHSSAQNTVVESGHAHWSVWLVAVILLVAIACIIPVAAWGHWHG